MSRIRMPGLRWAIVPVVLVPVVAVLFVGFGRDPNAIPSPLIGKPVPAFALQSIDGRTISSDDLAGRPMVVNFWASWCSPCVEEHPVLLYLQRQQGSRVAVVGILYDDGAENAARFLARYGDGGWSNLLDPGASTAIDFGVTGPPETFFVDAQGIVRAKQIGPLTSDALPSQLAAIGVQVAIR